QNRRVYISRNVGNQVMMPADLKAFINTCARLNTSALSLTRCARWSKSYGPSWHTSCRQRGREVELIPRPARCITGKLGAKESPGGEARAFKEKSCEYLGIKVP